MHPRVVGTGIYKGRLAMVQMENATHLGGKKVMKKLENNDMQGRSSYLHAKVVYVEPAALDP